MPKFTFRLRTLLRLREAARDDRRLELAEAYRADDLLRERLQGVGEELGGLQDRCRRAVAPGPVNVDELIEVQRYELALEAQQRQLNQQREVLAAEIERRRQALVQANREVRVLEKLRQKQAQRYHQEENRRQIKGLDEVAWQCAGREDVR